MYAFEQATGRDVNSDGHIGRPPVRKARAGNPFELAAQRDRRQDPEWYQDVEIAFAPADKVPKPKKGKDEKFNFAKRLGIPAIPRKPDGTLYTLADIPPKPGGGAYTLADYNAYQASSTPKFKPDGTPFTAADIPKASRRASSSGKKPVVKSSQLVSKSRGGPEDCADFISWIRSNWQGKPWAHPFFVFGNHLYDADDYVAASESAEDEEHDDFPGRSPAEAYGFQRERPAGGWLRARPNGNVVDQILEFYGDPAEHAAELAESRDRQNALTVMQQQHAAAQRRVSNEVGRLSAELSVMREANGRAAAQQAAAANEKKRHRRETSDDEDVYEQPRGSRGQAQIRKRSASAPRCGVQTIDRVDSFKQGMPKPFGTLEAIPIAIKPRGGVTGEQVVKAISDAFEANAAPGLSLNDVKDLLAAEFAKRSLGSRATMSNASGANRTDGSELAAILYNSAPGYAPNSLRSASAAGTLRPATVCVRTPTLANMSLIYSAVTGGQNVTLSCNPTGYRILTSVRNNTNNSPYGSVPSGALNGENHVLRPNITNGHNPDWTSGDAPAAATIGRAYPPVGGANPFLVGGFGLTDGVRVQYKGGYLHVVVTVIGQDGACAVVVGGSDEHPSTFGRNTVSSLSPTFTAASDMLEMSTGSMPVYAIAGQVGLTPTTDPGVTPRYVDLMTNLRKQILPTSAGERHFFIPMPTAHTSFVRLDNQTDAFTNPMAYHVGSLLACLNQGMGLMDIQVKGGQVELSIYAVAEHEVMIDTDVTMKRDLNSRSSRPVSVAEHSVGGFSGWGSTLAEARAMSIDRGLNYAVSQGVVTAELSERAKAISRKWELPQGSGTVSQTDSLTPAAYLAQYGIAE